MKYLLTGGAGYIGLHVALAIKNSGHDVLLADNFSNSNIDNIKHIKNVLGICLHVEVGDIRSKDFTDKLFKKYQIDAQPVDTIAAIIWSVNPSYFQD